MSNRVWAIIGVIATIMSVVAFSAACSGPSLVDSIFNGGTRGALAAQAIPVTTGGTGAANADVNAGMAKFRSVGCSSCHGDNGQGNIFPGAPKLSGTALNLDQVKAQVRKPRDPSKGMPPFSETQVSDEDVQNIYSWLQTKPADVAATATPSATASPAASVTAPASTLKHFDPVGDPPDPTKGQVTQVKNGSVSVSDISVGNGSNGPWFQPYDNDAKTALVIVCDDPNGCWLRFDFGGDANVTQTADALVNQLLASGCGSKCAAVKVVHWPTDRCGIDKGNKPIIPGACQTGGPAATATPGASATSTAVPSTPARTTGGTNFTCLPTARYLELQQQAISGANGLHDRISRLIVSMDQEYEAEPSRGYRGGPGGVIDNPGPAGVAIVWTDTGSSPSFVPQVTDPAKAGDVSKNWLPVEGFIAPSNIFGSGWGFRRLYTAATMKSGFTAIRLCEALP